jgi:hypothetical protein
MAYAACAWALVFAAIGLYWGGRRHRAAGHDRGRDRAQDARAGRGLALVRPFGERLPRGPLAWLLAIGGVLLILYGTAELVQHLLMALGAVDRSGLDDTAVYGHVLMWDPWWILGGALFALAGWRNRPVRDRARR